MAKHFAAPDIPSSNEPARRSRASRKADAAQAQVPSSTPASKSADRASAATQATPTPSAPASASSSTPPRAEQQRSFPTTEEIAEEYKRSKYRGGLRRAVRGTIYTLITVAAIAVLVAVLLLPVLRIYGSSMNPSLNEGDLVVSVKGTTMETGDVLAFYYNNNVLVKRVIAHAGQWVDIAEDGTVYVDNQKIEEPYLTEKAFGECDITLPYQVPESRIFVMGDNRDVSVDSRNTAVGCVAEEQIVGKIVFRVWPLSEFGPIQADPAETDV